jgi:transcriptional regulator with XRE-family HTH domain
MVTSPSLHKALGEYLKDKRSETGLTQSDVAKKLGYSTPQFISNFERGLCAPPLKNLKLLVKLYKLDANELIDVILNEEEESLRKTLNIRKR